MDEGVWVLGFFVPCAALGGMLLSLIEIGWEHLVTEDRAAEVSKFSEELLDSDDADMETQTWAAGKTRAGNDE